MRAVGRGRVFGAAVANTIGASQAGPGSLDRDWHVFRRRCRMGLTGTRMGNG